MDDELIETGPSFVVARILLILGESDVRRLVATILKSAGYVVEALSDSSRAEEQLQKGSFELAVLDLEYRSGPSGFVVLRDLRARGFKQPALFLSQGAGAEDILALLRLGADDVLRKTLRPEELLAAVRRLLGRYRAGGI